MTQTNWHYTVSRTKFGPVSEEQLLSMLSEGRVKGDALVWREGTSAWVSLADVPQFARFAQVAAPSPPPLPSYAAAPPPLPSSPSPQGWQPLPSLPRAVATPPPVLPATTEPVSPKYQRIFDLIDKAGGPSLPKFRSLTIRERLCVNLNWSARFGGPLWYLSKGMPKRALTQGLFLSQMNGIANISYYKKVRFGDNGWW